MAKIQLRWTDHTRSNLDKRVRDFCRADSPITLDPKVRAVQFLRGASARSSHVMPALYQVIGARTAAPTANLPYSGKVQAAVVEDAFVNLICLACRSVFDDGRKGLTGKAVSGLSDTQLDEVAQ